MSVCFFSAILVAMVGKSGKTEKVGKVGKVEKVGKVGKVAKVEKADKAVKTVVLEKPATQTRRTQAERRASTRGVLLDATIDTLIDLGYAATTTTLVTRRAGVSQGALFNHFPSKAALVAAAAEVLFERLIDQFRAAFARMKPGEDRVSVAIRRLWDVYHDPGLPVAYSLYCAAASDSDLADALRPVVLRHGGEIDEAARSLFPEIADGPELRSLLDIVVYAMQGLTLQNPVYSDPSRTEVMLTQLEALGRLALSFAPKKPLEKKP